MTAGILYLHGFRSSPSSAKARALGEALNTRGLSQRFFCPALSPEPDRAIAQAEALIHDHPGPLTLVGSSLGGFYASCLAEKHGLKALLINPAVLAAVSLEQHIGWQTHLHSGEPFEFTAAHVEQLRRLEPPHLSPERYWLWLETGDEVLDYRDAVARYAGCRQSVFAGGDHSFTRFPDLLPQLLEYCGL